MTELDTAQAARGPDDGARQQRSEGYGLALGFVGVLIFSVTLPATRVAVEAFGAWTTGIGRAVVAAACAAVVLFVTKTNRPNRQQLRALLVVGGGVIIGFPLFSALALETSTASRGAIVIGTLPATTALVATLRHGERPSWQFWLAAIGGLVTVVVYSVVTGANGRPELADLFFMLAVVAAAIGYGEGARLTGELGGWQTISWALVIALPITLPITVIALSTQGVDNPGFSNWLGLAYVAVFSMYLGFVAWYAGLSIGGTARVSQIQLLQPMLTLGWAALLLDETITAAGVITAVIVLLFVAASKRAPIHRRT
jgi:drug/metabolite transporter (DMT)-like permease